MSSMEALILILSLFTLIGAVAFFYFYLPWGKPKGLEDAKSHFIQIENINLHYKVCGSGPPILLLHGIGASEYTWRNLVPLLSDHHEVITLDLVGFGKSDKPLDFSYLLDDQAKVIHQFLHKIKRTKNLSLVGSSMGGAIALWLINLEPELYKKAYLISPACNPQHTKNLNLKLMNLFQPSPKLYLKPLVMKQLLKRVLSNHKIINAEMIENYLRPFWEDKNAVPAFIKAFENGLKDSRMPAIFSGLPAELHLLWGTKDKLTHIRYAQELKDLLPNVKLHTLEGGSHHLMEDSPEWTAKILTESLDQSDEVSQ